MINKFIIASILAASGFACAEKPYRSTSSQTSTQTTTQASTDEHSKAQAEAAQARAEGKDVDNTAMNKRDSEDTTLTPMDQTEGSTADVELTRKIREALNDNESLSTSAQNVKIITLKGITTLRGPVNSMAEKRKIEQVAKTAGAKRVKNQLEVKTKTE